MTEPESQRRSRAATAPAWAVLGAVIATAAWVLPVNLTSASSVTEDEEVVDTMRRSPGGQQPVPDEIAQSSPEAAPGAQEHSLTQLQAERARLAREKEAVAAELARTQKIAQELQQQVAAATQDATTSRTLLARLQQQLAEKDAEAGRQKDAFANLEKSHAEARKQIQGLTMALVVAEQEKKSLRETAEALRTQAQAERLERLKVQDATTEPAERVDQPTREPGAPAEKSRERPALDASLLFSEFQANRVSVTIAANRRGFLGLVTRQKDAHTVLVSNGQQALALMHIADTPFPITENGADWESLQVRLSRGGPEPASAASMAFLAQDPRLVALLLSENDAAALGAKVYPLSSDPFKFPEALLIDGGGLGYGEIGFRLDPTHPGFVRLESRQFRRIFGDFSPKRGDLVFSKSGEFIGLMVNNEYCAWIRDLTPLKSIIPGDNVRTQATSAILDAVATRIRNLPLDMQ